MAHSAHPLPTTAIVDRLRLRLRPVAPLCGAPIGPLRTSDVAVALLRGAPTGPLRVSIAFDCRRQLLTAIDCLQLPPTASDNHRPPSTSYCSN